MAKAMFVAHLVTTQFTVLVEFTSKSRKVAIVNAISFDGILKNIRIYFP